MSLQCKELNKHEGGVDFDHFFEVAGFVLLDHNFKQIGRGTVIDWLTEHDKNIATRDPHSFTPNDCRLVMRAEGVVWLSCWDHKEDNTILVPVKVTDVNRNLKVTVLKRRFELRLPWQGRAKNLNYFGGDNGKAVYVEYGIEPHRVCR